MPMMKKLTLVGAAFVLASCGSDNNNLPVDPPPPPPPAEPTAAEILTNTLDGLGGAAAFTLPASDDFDNIPQDPSNPLTAEKVALGKLLFHETALATEGVNGNLNGTWSCASCHHAAAGFKSGVLQGIGEGGSGFGEKGEGRVLAANFDKASADPTLVPDVQPFTSPTILNTAYQEVMLWNGQFGNAVNGVVNVGLEDNVLATPGTPKAENVRELAGLEIQAVAGTGVHRLRTFNDSILQTNEEYIALFDAAFPNSAGDHLEDAGKAMAAFERTVLANEAPFQKWLNGEADAMTEAQMQGATLFFGKAGCADCHNGPGLNSPVGSTEDEMFFALGFEDFDVNNPAVTGGVGIADARGRGGFTGEEEDFFKFKVPTLYNLTDTNIFGHGGSFDNVRDVVAYKNAAVPQKVLPEGTLDPRFVPLGLTDEEIDLITVFLEEALYDPNLTRYVPESLPSGQCSPVNDAQAKIDLGC
ncbi:cytochrome-c peroxidase [Alteromonas sp. a30]|uniref:cytochrome-c peroxidase n=1 Tax=Alteromonas sp. a30 TaxID=2730917 RepID=UPI00227E1974|nr:cytochrome c peroxidase [Alteromonas sp. a30]MCY7295529.1 cytochrome-c peroxidase [Alteromonas sp. a30]